MLFSAGLSMGMRRKAADENGWENTGPLCGILAAVTYGMNPLFALPLYERGLSTSSVLFYRYLFTILLLGGFMLLRGQSLRLGQRQRIPMGVSGILLGFSSLFLFLSFHYIDAGIAITIMFVYPVIVCGIMFACFHVRQSISTLIGMILAVAGIGLLSPGEAEGGLNFTGVAFVLLAALTYSVYMVLLKVTSIRDLSAAALTFYSLLFGLPVFFFSLKCGAELQKLPDLFSFCCALALAVFPSLLSFLFMAIAIRDIGPTRTAILGALEPVTALFFGITLFGETLSFKQSLGVLVILGSVTLVVMGRKSVAGGNEGASPSPESSPSASAASSSASSGAPPLSEAGNSNSI